LGGWTLSFGCINADESFWGEKNELLKTFVLPLVKKGVLLVEPDDALW
jgi:hypothetical protein